MCICVFIYIEMNSCADYLGLFNPFHFFVLAGKFRLIFKCKEDFGLIALILFNPMSVAINFLLKLFVCENL